MASCTDMLLTCRHVIPDVPTGQYVPQARKENQELRKGQFPHLPAELWEKICKLLTTKDLARALLPSCMALHG